MAGSPRGADGGFVLLVFMVTLIPLLLVAATYTQTMIVNGHEVGSELDHELAFLAAESGIDDAIFKGQTGQLHHGVSYTRDMGNGVSFKVEPTHLTEDLNDNDGDSEVDEPDEDVFQVVVTGRYRNMTKRVAAYLGPVPLVTSITNAVTMTNPTISIDLRGTARVSGINVDMTGKPIGSGDVPGLAITDPNAVSYLMSELTPSEQSQVLGLGGPPSIAKADDIDLGEMVAQVQNTANLVLTSSKYANYDFGDGPGGKFNVIYRDGDLEFAGNSHGAGVMLVKGSLEMKGNFRFDGIVIVLGDVTNSAGTALIQGGLIIGAGGNLLQLKGTADIRFSTTVISSANASSGKYVAFNGWQDLSAK